jgi:phosphoribosylanthranilate isomerase
VFVNEETPEQVKAVASEAGVSAIQLHGDESPDYCSALRDSYVIKAFAVSEAFDIRTTLEYSVDAVLLDASHRKLRGGTGQVIDWTGGKARRRTRYEDVSGWRIDTRECSRGYRHSESVCCRCMQWFRASPRLERSRRLHAFFKAVRS